MDFEFAPSFNRQSNADLTIYGSTFNGNSRKSSNKECALNCQFSRKITEKLGWVKGDRLRAKWSDTDKSLIFFRVGVDDPAMAYKVSFCPPKKKECHARVRLGCPAEALLVILGNEKRVTFSFFEAAGNSATFVAT
jgi:hypothetical protein